MELHAHPPCSILLVAAVAADVAIWLARSAHAEDHVNLLRSAHAQEVRELRSTGDELAYDRIARQPTLPLGCLLTHLPRVDLPRQRSELVAKREVVCEPPLVRVGQLVVPHPRRLQVQADAAAHHSVAGQAQCARIKRSHLPTQAP